MMAVPLCSHVREAGAEVKEQSKRAISPVAVRTSSGSVSNTVSKKR